MTPVKAALALAMIFLGFVASGSALAWGHGPRVRFGVVVGGPLWWGPGYYGPYYAPYYYPPYYPPVVSVPSSPPVYIEQGNAQPAPRQSEAYWYYCADAKAYYPYVKECPGGWQRVAPQPPPG